MAASDARDRLLAAAEELFAERGFHGVFLREIAAHAGMRLSHLQYHFSSKDDLYHAVFQRRILTINHARLIRLDEAEQRMGAAGSDPLEDIVRAFVEPAVLVARDDASGGGRYAQLIAQISNEPAEHARRVSRDFTDPIARITLKSLTKALPDLDVASLTWAYLFAVGAMIASISRTGRVKILSNGACDPDDVERIVSLVVPFISGGLRAVAESERTRNMDRAGPDAGSSSGAKLPRSSKSRAPAKVSTATPRRPKRTSVPPKDGAGGRHRPTRKSREKES